MNPTTIKIDEVEYIRKDSITEKPPSVDGMEFKIVRGQATGVFAGYVEKRNGQEVVMRNARRIWYWAGAASLSQLAMEGTSKPESCQFPTPVDRVEILDVIEILDVTSKAKTSIDGVKVWRQ
jgi:hypothetical protein